MSIPQSPPARGGVCSASTVSKPFTHHCLSEPTVREVLLSSHFTGEETESEEVSKWSKAPEMVKPANPVCPVSSVSPGCPFKSPEESFQTPTPEFPSDCGTLDLGGGDSGEQHWPDCVQVLVSVWWLQWFLTASSARARLLGPHRAKAKAAGEGHHLCCLCSPTRESHGSHGKSARGTRRQEGGRSLCF